MMTSDSGDDTPWLTAEQQHDWRALVGLLMTLPPALDAQLKRDAGLNNFEYHILAGLSDAPDRTLPMSDLSHFAQGSLSRLSHAVTRLERAGWVARRVSDDGRRNLAQLTPAGWTKISETAPGHVREARRLVVERLTARQLRDLGTAARTIVATVDPVVHEALQRERWAE